VDNLQNIADQIRNFLSLVIFKTDKFSLEVADLISVIIILLGARLLIWLFKKYFNRQKHEGKLDAGKTYAYTQLLAYLVYVIAIVLIIENLGFSITVLLAGSTALLVGLGLGLQDFFRDLVAGFIILTERTVTAGDIVEIAGVVGKVKEVGLRTTLLLTREDIVLIVPNSKLIQENVINWSQNNKITRFRIDVGVAYGSDTARVREVLIAAVKDHPEVIANQPPVVFFEDFGNSSLDFSVLFYSRNLFRIERTKSELRFKIDQLFRENGITIPFPQRDVWFRSKPDKEQ
jgi:small-conductance mechanosensitive channel